MFSSASFARPFDAKTVAYGTAGFRSKAEVLYPFVPYRVGILAALRSISHHGKTCGVMITASHNPPQDNGVKIVEPDGSMLVQEWEAHATRLINTEEDELTKVVQSLVSELGLDLKQVPKIFCGYDTRDSSVDFSKATIEGVRRFENAVLENFELCTTPHIHYLVVADNTRNDKVPYGECSKQGYYRTV